MFSALRLAFRQLTKAPGFTATVVIVLALGVGATTAIFSVVHAVLLHPFPYVDGDQIAFIGSKRLGQEGFMSVTYPDYLDWKERAKTIELAFANGSATTLTDIAEPAVLRNGAVSASVWPLLGMQPVRGRVFTAAEDQPGAEAVCVLSFATWQNRFASDPQIVGHPVMLDGKPYTVVGVMPSSFKFWAADVWTPVGLQADTDLMRSRVLRMDAWVVGKPHAGTSLEEATKELNLIAAQLGQQYPESNKDTGVHAQLLSDAVSGGFRGPLLMLLGAVGCVLLIACANVANLLLARTATRQKEYAIRAALGANRVQLVRQMIVESLPLALLGGFAGILVAMWGLRALLVILPSDAVPIESLERIHVNGAVMLSSLALTLGTLLLFALFPAIESSRTALNPVLKEESRGSAGPRAGRVRTALIVAEVSLSLVLLVGAGLLIRSFAQLRAVDPGFNAENLLVVPIQLTPARYATGQQATAFFADVVERLHHVPAIKAVAASTNAPFFNGMGLPLLTEGRNYTDINQLDGVQFSCVMSDYFPAQGLQLLQGRTFADTDQAASQPVIILNEAAVKRFIPEGDPLGQRVMLGVPENLLTPNLLPPGLDKFQWATVVGVVRSTRHFALQADPTPEAYIPVAQSWEFLQLRSFMLLVVRTDGDPLRAVPAVREAVAAVDRNQPLGRIATAETIIRESLGQSRFMTLLLGLFATVALALAIVGIYGVVTWNVAQRTREIGIRQALGANRADVLRLVINQAMRVVALGLALGVAASLVVAWFAKSLVFGISAFDPWTYVAVALALTASAFVACLLPARRATQVEPLVALRTE